jgi:hypothetical protein
METQASTDPTTQPPVPVTAPREGATTAQATGGNPDGSGTPVTGGWPPPAK